MSGAARFYEKSVKSAKKETKLLVTYTHNERELLLVHTLAHLVRNTILRHLGCLVVGWYRLVGGHKILIGITSLESEDLLNTTIEEEGDVSVLLGLSNVDLLDVLLAEPLSQHIVHALRLEADGEGVLELVLGHGGEADLGVGEVGENRTVDITKDLSDLTNAVCRCLAYISKIKQSRKSGLTGSVVEEQDGIVIWASSQLEVHIVLVKPSHLGCAFPCHQQ